MITKMEELRLIERIGAENAAILIKRYIQHRRGLWLSAEPYESHPHQVCDIVPEEREPQEMFASIPAQYQMLEEIRQQNPTLSMRELGFALFEKWNAPAKPAVHYDLDPYCREIADYLAEDISWERCLAIMGMKRPL